MAWNTSLHDDLLASFGAPMDDIAYGGGGGGGANGAMAASAQGLAAQLAADSGLKQAGLQAQASKYGADQNLAGLRYSTDAQMSRLKAQQDFATSRWNQLFPLVQGQYGGAGAAGGAAGGAGAYGPYGGGGYGPPAPAGGFAGVYSPDQVQQQVNAQVATSDAKGQGDYRRALAEASGRGLGAGSPLAAALRARYDAATAARGADIRRQVPFDAAQANADMGLQRESLAAQEYASRQSEDIQRQQVAQSGRNALLASLAGLLSSGT